MPEVVGKLTCLVRFVDDRSVRKWVADGSSGLSTWMLKSPVMRNS